MMSKVKLKTILPYIDALSEVIIWENIAIGTPEWKDVFTGYVMDVPWIYLEKHLATPEQNDGEEAMCPYVTENGQAGLRITLGD